MIVFYAVLAFLICTLVVVLFRKNDRRFKKLMDQLPGPRGYYILGNLPDLMCDDEIFFKRLRKWAIQYGPVYNLSCLYLATVNITDPEDFELVVSSTKNAKKAQIYVFLKRWLGKGLLTSAGSKWKSHRKILSSAFHFGILQNFVSVFHRETDRLVAILKKFEGEEINIVPLAAQFTLYAIAETSLGVSLDTKRDEDIEYVNSLFKIGKIFYHRMMRPWLHNNTIFYNLSSTGKLEKRLLKIFHDFNNEIVKKRSKRFTEVKSTVEPEHSIDKKKLAMLDLLLEAKYSKGKINDKEIQDEVSTFMFAGQDTTSMSLCFTLMLLASHEKVQDRVVQEIFQFSCDNSHQLTLNELNNLKYMEMVIKESLRLYPSAPFIARILEEDLVTKEGYLLPKGANVNIHIFDIHRNPKQWPEPDTFDPERFLPKNCATRHPFSYVPFSAGSRNCIGQKFALLELKAALYGVLKNFIVVPVDTPESIVLVPDIVLRARHERIILRFLPRKNV